MDFEVLARIKGGEPKWVAASKLSQLFVKKKKRVNSPSPPILKGFEDWWKRYDKKVTKKQAKDYWLKHIKEHMITGILYHTKQYVEQTEKRYRLDPIRYLRNEKFNDEIISQEKKIDLDELYPFDKTGNARLGICSKCNKTTFGNKFTIHKDDSDCCNAKINKYR